MANHARELERDLAAMTKERDEWQQHGHHEADMRNNLMGERDDVRLKLELELETERMRLAACGVVAMADTETSRVEARKMLPKYRSASLSDVERRVDECIELRKQLREEQRLHVQTLNERDEARRELASALRREQDQINVRKVNIAFAEKYKEQRARLAEAIEKHANTLPFYALADKTLYEALAAVKEGTDGVANEPDLGEWLGPVAVKTLEDAASIKTSYCCEKCGCNAQRLPDGEWLSRINPGTVPSRWTCQACSPRMQS